MQDVSPQELTQISGGSDQISFTYQQFFNTTGISADCVSTLVVDGENFFNGAIPEDVLIARVYAACTLDELDQLAKNMGDHTLSLSFV